MFSDKILLQFVFSYFTARLYSRLCQLWTFAGVNTAYIIIGTQFFQLLKLKKISVPKTEGKSFLFHIGNEFPNMISITSEVGYVKAFQLWNLYLDFCKIVLVVYSYL